MPPAIDRALTAKLLALGAISLWATLAALGLALAHVPPFLLTGLALLVGALPALPFIRQWRIPASTLALGVYGLFGFHFLLFIALRNAPAVEANLVNYLWPLLMVLLAPLLLPGMHLHGRHLVAALAGFAGAAVAILGAGGDAVGTGGWHWGYLPALGSAIIWSSYSLLCRRVAHFPTAAVGLFALVSGLLSLVCHWLLEPAVSLGWRDAALIGLIGLGPMGAAFFLWDKALKLGDARQIAVLSYLTPLASTGLLVLAAGRGLGWHTLLAAALIIGAALMAPRRT